jgi:hypothetical protein
MERNEGRGRPGAPKSQEQARGQRESKERQPLPNVWDILERRARIQERYSSLGELPRRQVLNKLHRDDLELRHLEDSIHEEGTPRDKHILDLFHLTVPFLPGSLEQFQQFRSKVEPLSNNEITEELRKHSEAIREKTPQGPVFYSGVGLDDLIKREDKKP